MISKFKKYQINIKTDEGFDRDDEEFNSIEQFMNHLVNELLEDHVTVLVARIPDAMSIADIESNGVTIMIQLLREKFAAIAPNCCVVGLQFDVECVNKPDKIICWPEIFELFFVDEDMDIENEEHRNQYEARLNKAIEDMAARINSPKLIIP